MNTNPITDSRHMWRQLILLGWLESVLQNQRLWLELRLDDEDDDDEDWDDEDFDDDEDWDDEDWDDEDWDDEDDWEDEDEE